MANTYHQIYVHVVFAVSGRQSKIKSEWQDELYQYIGGGIKNHGHTLIAIGGVEDHIHILLGLSPKESIADLVQSIKIQSSKWINHFHSHTGQSFSWQRGYGVFSYSRSQINQVIHYINNQRQHHRTESMNEEYKRILCNLGIEFDERYIFDEIQPPRG